MPYVFTAPDVVEPAPIDQNPPEPDPTTEPAAPDAAPNGAATDGGNPDDSEVGGRPVPKRPPKVVPTGGVQGTITWTEITEIKEFPAKLGDGGGVYIVCGEAPGNVPLYVGETDNFAVRWRKRMLEGHQAGLFGRQPHLTRNLYPINLATKPIRLWLGKISLSREAREILEWAIVRLLDRGGLGRDLANDRSVNPFAATAPIQIAEILPESLKVRLILPTKGGAEVIRAVTEARRHNSLGLAPQTVFEIDFYD